MENLYFYPTLTSEMIDKCGVISDKYTFTFKYQDEDCELHQKGKTTVRLSDSLDIWEVEKEGITIEKTVRIAYPELLKGPSGVACRDSELGLCIMWTNKKLTQTGCILPVVDDISPRGRTCVFRHTFKPGELSGDLELSLEMFIKNRADNILSDEEYLINEDGVTVGEIEKVFLDFKSVYMLFPIEECNSEKEPLWWVEFFSEWEDPKTIDMFSEESFCLYLNPHYDACPAPTVGSAENGIKNFDLMVDILAQTYLMLFQRLGEDDLRATKQDIGLSDNTICSILHQFIMDCEEELYLEYEYLQSSPERVLKSLQINIRKMLQEDSN